MKFVAAVVLVVAFVSPCAGAVSAVEEHWVPRAELDLDDRSALPAYCGGMYVEREFSQPLGVRSGSFPVRLRGDRVEYTNEGTGELVGRVSFEQGNRMLTGERAVVREVGATREVSFPDGLLFTEPGVALTGTSASFDLAGERGRVEDVDFVLFAPEFRGTAALVERRDDALTVESTRLTRCAPGNETWRVEAGRIDIAKGDAFARAPQRGGETQGRADLLFAVAARSRFG